MKRRILAKVLGLAVLACGTAFQGTGCTPVNGNDLRGFISAGFQGFANGMFTQWIGGKFNGLFHVDD